MDEDIGGRLQNTLNTSADLKKRMIYLWGAVNEENAYKFILALRLLDESPGEIVVWLCTNGGDVSDGMAIYDAIRLAKNQVTIVGTGSVWSMGSIILQAGAARILTQEARLMVHDGHAELSGDPRTLASLGEDLKFSHERDLQILAVRSGRTFQVMSDLSQKTTFFSAKEALEIGLIDAVLTPEGLVTTYTKGVPTIVRRRPAPKPVRNRRKKK